MKKHLADYIWLFLTAGIIILADQVTKYLVYTNLPIGTVYRPELWLSQYARIVHWKNTGAAFGIFQNLSGLFMVFSFLVSAVIIYYYPQVSRRDWIVRLAMGMLLGGAVGNLIDRLHLGYVVDFISVGPFPVLNIADACISMGVVVLFFGMWQQERQKNAALKQDPGDQVQLTKPENSSSALPKDAQGE